MWSLFREFSLNQTLSTEQTYLGQKLIDTMSSTFGTALIKPSSLHTEFLVKHIVKPHQSRAVFLINNWKSCVLNGLKKIQNGELPEGELPALRTVFLATMGARQTAQEQSSQVSK